MQASEYAAESYEKPPAERGVSHMSWAFTDEEREAIEWFATFGNSPLAPWSNNWSNHAAILRNLLERTK
jgi:hypothetical protein